VPIPKYFQLFNPPLVAVRELGGSASISELEDHVSQNLSLTEEELAEENEKGQRRFAYRLAWARSYLKAHGLLDSSERGVTRDGAPPIDLVDRELLLDKLRELRLGVKVETVERVTPDPSWFADL